MPTYLRHKPTGDIMIATPYLMERPDMELVEEEKPAPSDKPAAKKRTAKKKVVEEVVSEPVSSEDEADVVSSLFDDVD